MKWRSRYFLLSISIIFTSVSPPTRTYFEHRIRVYLLCMNSFFHSILDIIHITIVQILIKHATLLTGSFFWYFFLVLLSHKHSLTHSHSFDHFSIDSPLTLIKYTYIQRAQGAPASMAHPATRNGSGWWGRVLGRTSIPNCCESKLRYCGRAAFPNTIECRIAGCANGREAPCCIYVAHFPARWPLRF